VLCGLLIATCVGSATSQPALSAADAATLKEGRVVIEVSADPDGAAGRVRAIIDIPVTPKVLWATMLDCSRAPRFIAGLESCKVLSQDPAGAWDVREHRVRWISMLPQVRSEFRSEYVTEQRISFRRTGGDLKALEGQWLLSPQNGGRSTRLFYTARVDPGVSLPNMLVRAAIESDVPKTLEALRNEAVARRGG
jgi:hypothetical protein